MPRLQIPLKPGQIPASRAFASALAASRSPASYHRPVTPLVSTAYISPRDPFRATFTHELSALSFSGSICPFPYRHPSVRREMTTSTPAEAAAAAPNAEGAIGTQVPDAAAASESTSGITAEMLEGRLKETLNATEVAVEDISGGCGQSFAATIVSPAFAGKTTLARHRLVNSALREEIARIHAWTPKCMTPEEQAKKR